MTVKSYHQNQSCPPLLNFEYINEELEKLGLLKFGNYAKDLSLVWFEKEESSEVLDQMADTIFKSGIYGTLEQSVAIDLCFNGEDLNNLEESKFKYFFKKMFPPFGFMKNRNPILNKIPILLPWFYFTRLLKFQAGI